MTLMGQKRDKDKPRAWIKRSNGPTNARTRSKAGKESDKAYRAFMEQFRGLPCLACRRTWFLKNDKGEPILTSGHHLLYRSTHPQYKMTPENVVPLCVKHHVPFAHEQPKKFKAWMQKYHPLIWAWVEEHDHHRKEG